MIGESVRDGPDQPTGIGPRIAGAVLATSLSQVVVIVLAFGTSIAQARLLGADGRGDLARFVNAGALVALYFGLGIGSAITYFLAAGAAQPRALLRSLAPVFVATVLAVPVCLGNRGPYAAGQISPT